MGDDIETAVQLTQESLGSLITKPKLTEKYLKKPPFRFLHDIVIEVIRATGFGQGLFTTEECDAGSLGDKAAKVEFLTKVISCTSFALGQEIAVAPGKIVAGLEPEKTNLWLQKLHEAATTAQAQSESAVSRVLAGETTGVSSKKEKKKKEEPGPPPPAAPPPMPAEEAPPPGEDLAAQQAALAARQAEEAQRRAEEQAAAEEQRLREEKKARKKEEERRAKEEEKRRRQEEAAAAQAAAEAAQAEAAEEQMAQGQEEPAGMMQMQGGGAAPMTMQQETEQQGGTRSRGAAAAAPEEIAARAEALMAAQGGGGGGGAENLERPRTAGRKPPKVTSKVTSKTADVAPQVEAPLVIGDGDMGKDDEDDEDMFVEKPAATHVAVRADEGEHHGKLVREILEEKKKEEEKKNLVDAPGTAQAEKVEEQQDTAGGIKMGKLKRKKDQAQQYANIDVLKLRESIQQLCQAANPLGKSIDLVHQDIANMGKELDHWRQENRNAVERYHQERKVTEETLMPLHRRMAELEESIAEANTKVQNSRSRILKNDVQIQNLLESVMASK